LNAQDDFGKNIAVAPRELCYLGWYLGNIDYNTTEYVGQGYAIPTPAGIEMIKTMARMEGIFLDPVYTGKAMAGLYDHIKQGQLTSDDVVLFLHTAEIHYCLLIMKRTWAWKN